MFSFEQRSAAASKCGLNVCPNERHLTIRSGGVAKSYEKAAEHFRRASQMQDARGLTNLAWMLILGQGMKRDDDKAIELFKAAAKQGYPAAEDSLGFAYEHGRGVQIDLDAAASWYRKAADHGFPKSIANLQRLSQQ